MPRISREKFEKIVAKGIEAIPEEFLKKLSNVVIVFEDEPTSEQRKKLKMRSGFFLLGLYEGVPQAGRGAGYTAVLPDKITIFKNAIESLARDEDEMREMVKNTVWHEIAHHFGMGEERVRRVEAKRKNKSKNIS